MLWFRRKEPVKFHWPMVLIAIGLSIIVALVLFTTLPHSPMLITGAMERGPWLAALDGDTVFTHEFKQRYETSPHVGQGRPARLDFLEALILERLFADAAQRQQLDTLRKVEVMQQQLAAEARVEQYLRDKLELRVRIDSAEVRTHFLRAIRDLKLDAWICRDSSTAALVYQRAQKGVPFHQAGRSPELGQAVFVDGQTLKWNTTAPEFEDVAYSLQQGEVGGPVEGEGGWYVIRVTGFQVKRIPSEAAFAEIGPWVKDVLEGRVARDEQATLIQEQMQGMTMRIEPEPFEAVARSLHESLPRDNRIADLAPPMFAGMNDAIQPGNILRRLPMLHANQPMVRLTESLGEPSTWTVKETLEKLQTSPKPLAWEKNPAAFAKNLRDAIQWRIEFDRLNQLAEQAGYTTNPKVLEDREMWSRHVLALEAVQRVSEVVGFAESAGAPDTGITFAKTDSLVLNWIDEQVRERGGLSINREAVDALDVTDMAVFYRKRHFPNRPATPSPAPYTWALKWEPVVTNSESDSSPIE